MSHTYLCQEVALEVPKDSLQEVKKLLETSEAQLLLVLKPKDGFSSVTFGLIPTEGKWEVVER